MLNTIYLQANTTRKDGKRDRRFSPSNTRMFFVFENGEHVAEVDATTETGAIQRLGFHLGLNFREARERFTAEEA